MSALDGSVESLLFVCLVRHLRVTVDKRDGFSDDFAIKDGCGYACGHMTKIYYEPGTYG